MMMRKLFISGLAMLAATALCFDAGPLLAIVGAQSASVDQYLVAWYKLDGNALDSTANGYNGAWSGGAQYVAGISGQSASFVGTNYISVADDAALRPTNITVCAWLKAEASQGAGSAAIGKHLNYKIRPGNGGRLDFILYPGGSLVTLTNIMSSTEWYHVAMTYNSTTAVAYIDGAVVISRPMTGSITTAGNALGIGYDSFSPARTMKGLVDDVRIYNRALSSNDVGRVYQGLAPLHD